VDLYTDFYGMGYKPVACSVLQGNNHPEVECSSDEAIAPPRMATLHGYNS